MIEIEISPIGLGRFTPKKVRLAIEDALRDEVDVTVALLDQITENWSRRPRAKGTIKNEGGSLVGYATLNSRRAFFLNFGTAVRHARMSNSYGRKTRPGTLRGRGGYGRRRPVKISRSISGRSPDTGRPGITGRHWDEMIEDERKGPFRVNMAQAIARGSLAIFGFGGR